MQWVAQTSLPTFFPLSNDSFGNALVPNILCYHTGMSISWSGLPAHSLAFLITSIWTSVEEQRTWHAFQQNNGVSLNFPSSAALLKNNSDQLIWPRLCSSAWAKEHLLAPGCDGPLPPIREDEQQQSQCHCAVPEPSAPLHLQWHFLQQNLSSLCAFTSL